MLTYACVPAMTLEDFFEAREISLRKLSGLSRKQRVLVTPGVKHPLTQCTGIVHDLVFDYGDQVNALVEIDSHYKYLVDVYWQRWSDDQYGLDFDFDPDEFIPPINIEIPSQLLTKI